MAELLDPYGILPRIQSGEYQVLRQSTIGDADVCLRRVQYGRRHGGGTGEARVVGTGYHAGLAHYYEHRRLGEATNRADIIDAALAAFEQACGEHGGVQEWDTSRHEATGRVVDFIDGYFGGGHQWPDSYEILAVEQTFAMPLPWPGWAAWGTFDLVVRDGGGQVVVVDDHKTAKRKWKAGKESPRKNVQQIWYRHWAARLYDLEPDQVHFTFSTIGTWGFERRPAPRNGYEISQLFLKAHSLTSLIAQMDDGCEMPPNTDSFLCDARWCDHWDRCPFGEAFDRGLPVDPETYMRVMSPTHEEN